MSRRDKQYKFYTWLALPVFLILAVTLVACNAQKKNTAAARQYTAFITRYNIHYNGDKHYNETLKDMEVKYEDDYSRRVFMHPIEAKTDQKAPQPSGNFDRSIEKAQKAIQIRSIKKKPERKSGKANNDAYKAWMKRDEYNPFIHNSWMMMGRSQYYNGDFAGAASTFFYISRHFTWLPNVVTEAKMWQALAYISMDWMYEAEVIITRIKEKELTTPALNNLYNYVFADFYLHSDDYERALPYLEKAVNAASGAQKTRLRFLLGQVYERLGDKAKAYEAFKKAGSAASAPYRTKFNARIKQSEVYMGDNIEPEVKALKRMARYDRNKEYLDQVYYAIGNLYLSRRDTNNAIANYELAAKKSTRNGIDKAISQITLGNLYFELHNYEKAQPCYAEAIPLLPESYPNYKMLKKRSDVLDELAVYSQNVNLQDSLLRLSKMTREEQLVIINKIIEDLKKKEKEEAEEAAREKYLADRAAQGNNMKGGAAAQSQTFTLNSDDSWYFYNTSTRNAGKTEFQKRWGSRRLEDDWRRRNKASFNVSDFDSTDGADDENNADGATSNDSTEVSVAEREEQLRAEDPHYPEFYLKQIPSTDAERQTAHDIIQEGLYNMGVILKDKLEDFPAAISEFDRLLTDYPDNIYRLDTYYNLYLIYVRMDRLSMAERYRQLILTDFADSKYGIAMRDPNYLENLRNMDKVQQQMYDNTYQAYLDNRNADVHSGYAAMQEQYPMSKLLPKFMFLDALAYVTEGKPDEFNTTLRTLLERYPDTDITPIASSWLKGMAQGRKLQADGSGRNMRGMLWDIRLGNDSNAVANDSAANFSLRPDDPQLLVLVFPTDRVEPNALLYEIARHNFRSFVVKDFDLELMNFGRLGMLVVRGFDNTAQLNHYRRVMADAALHTDGLRLPADVRPIPISVANFETLLREGRTFDDYFRFLQEQDYEATQEPLLSPDEIESLQEAAERGNEPDEPESETDVVETPIETPVETPVETPAVAPVEAPAEEPKQVEPEPVPEPEPLVIPPAPARQPQPATQPQQQPKAQPKPQPQQQPKAQPKPQPTPQPASRPVMPQYDPGSEGDDDPLLD